MNINIKIINALTGQVEKDFIVAVVDSINEAGIDYMHDGYSEAYPDSHVNFTWKNGQNFIWGVPRNMTLDELDYENGVITWEQYCNKWYKGSLAGCNDDADFATIERYENEDWNKRDAICL